MPLIYEVTATSARCFDFTKHVESGSAPVVGKLATNSGQVKRKVHADMYSGSPATMHGLAREFRVDNSACVGGLSVVTHVHHAFR